MRKKTRRVYEERTRLPGNRSRARAVPGSANQVNQASDDDENPPGSVGSCARLHRTCIERIASGGCASMLD